MSQNRASIAGHADAVTPCTIKSLSVTVAKTGRTVQGVPEWQEVITNNCACAQSQIIANCKGFSSVVPIPPGVLIQQNDNCLVRGGAPIVQGQPFKFTFAAATTTPIVPTSSAITCP
ncbi:hypothetical protein NMG60_11023824 [Bertholletia excelsa]